VNKDVSKRLYLTPWNISVFSFITKVSTEPCSSLTNYAQLPLTVAPEVLVFIPRFSSLMVTRMPMNILDVFANIEKSIKLSAL
jgi:hypothetical protein